MFGMKDEKKMHKNMNNNYDNVFQDVDLPSGLFPLHFFVQIRSYKQIINNNN